MAAQLTYQTQEVLDGNPPILSVPSVQGCLVCIPGSPGCILSHHDQATISGSQHYQYWVLPLGLASVPWVFTKTMIVVVVALRQQGILIFPYVDNWLVVAHSLHLLQWDISQTLCLLMSLGAWTCWNLTWTHSNSSSHWSYASCPRTKSLSSSGQGTLPLISVRDFSFLSYSNSRTDTGPFWT